MMREIADDVSVVLVPRAAHWIAEDNRGVLVEALASFAGGAA